MLITGLILIFLAPVVKAEVVEYKTAFDPIIHGFTQRNDHTFIIPPDDALQIGKVRLNYLVIQGCCYGFTHTALNYFYTKDAIGNPISTSKDEVFEKNSYILPPESVTATLIRKKQMKNVRATTDIFVGLLRHLTSSSSKPDMTYAIAQLGQGKPVPLLIVSLPGLYGGENIQASGHSILAYKCVLNSEANKCSLYVHDPNYPRKWNKEKSSFDYDYNRKMELDLNNGLLLQPYDSSGRKWQIWSVDTTYTYSNPLGSKQ